MKRLLKSGFLVAALTAMTVANRASADVISAWTFENNAIAINNNPTASTGSGTASSVGMNLYATPNIGVTTDDILVGKSSDTGANGVANLTQIWRVRAQAGSSGAANGWSSQAPIGTQGAVFAMSTVGYSGAVNVSFDWYATTQGEANLQLQYTTDGTTWKNVPINIGANATLGLAALTNSTSSNTVTGSYISDNLLANGSLAGQDWFTGLTATINDPLADGNPNFAIEMVNASTGADDVSTQGTALNNTSGNWRFDNISVTGAAAVPEPSSFVLLGLTGGVIVIGCHLLRRRKTKPESAATVLGA
jgi:PEP-CTERM motif